MKRHLDESPEQARARAAAEPSPDPAPDPAAERARGVENRGRDIFDSAPLGLWIEDYTEVCAGLDALKARGIEDFDGYFTAHPEAVGALAAKIRMLDVNLASQTMFGATSKQELLRFLDPLTNAFTMDTVQVFRDQLVAMARGVDQFSIECAALTLQGTPIFVHVTLKLFPPDDGVIHALVSILDITQRRQTEDALADKEKLYRTLTETMPHMVWMGDAQGRITYCNPAMSAATGRLLAQTRGRDWTDDLHPGDVERIRTVQEAARRTHQSYRGECRLCAAGGAYRSVYFVVSPVKDEAGQVLHWVGVNTDITELKQAQEGLQTALDRSNTELAQIAYAASHDLQEPLRMVTSFTQLLAKRYAGQLDDRADKYIGYAVQGAKRIRRLIRDLLAFSHISMEGKPLRPTRCGVVLDRALAGLQQEILATDAEIVHDELPRLMADPGQLVLLFQHLVGNSLKFRGERAPRIAISARQDGTMWVLSVQDNGIGFDSKAYGGRIFQMFQRLHPPNVYPGTGIGLALAKKIVERHGGRIWVESRPGRGTRFDFTMPAMSEELVPES